MFSNILRIHAFVLVAFCFGSLSCIRMKLSFKPIFSALRLFLKMFLYILFYEEVTLVTNILLHIYYIYYIYYYIFYIFIDIFIKEVGISFFFV